MCQQAALKNYCQEKCQQEQTFPEMANILKYNSYDNENDSFFKLCLSLDIKNNLH